MAKHGINNLRDWVVRTDLIKPTDKHTVLEAIALFKATRPKASSRSTKRSSECPWCGLTNKGLIQIEDQP